MERIYRISWLNHKVRWGRFCSAPYLMSSVQKCHTGLESYASTHQHLQNARRAFACVSMIVIRSTWPTCHSITTKEMHRDHKMHRDLSISIDNVMYTMPKVMYTMHKSDLRCMHSVLDCTQECSCNSLIWEQAHVPERVSAAESCLIQFKRDNHKVHMIFMSTAGCTHT